MKNDIYGSSIGNIILRLLILFLTVYPNIIYADTYSAIPRSPMPIGLWNFTAAYVPTLNKIYVFGGKTVDNSTSLSAKIYAYDIITDTWSQAPGLLPYAMERTSAAVGGNGKIYLAPGIGPTENNGWGTHSKLIEYDPASGNAVEKGDLGFTTWGNELVAYQGDIYIFGGWSGSAVNKIWHYSPQAENLTLVGSTLQQGANAVSGMLGTDNLIYLFSGYPTKYIQIFDPSQNTVNLSAQLNDVLEDPLVWMNMNNLFFVGDYTQGKIYGYDPAAQSMTELSIDLGSTAMKSLRWGTTVTLPNGRIFIMGGNDNDVALANVFEVSSDSVLSNSKLYLTGGSINGTTVSDRNNTITVPPGAMISGTIKLSSENNYNASAVVPVIYQPSWGDRTTSYQTINSWIGTGSVPLDVNISLTAPTTPGTYFIIFASSGEMDGVDIASMTNWNAGNNVWNDGNDLVDLTEEQLSESLTNGYIIIPDYLFADGKRAYGIGCSYIKVVVSSPSIGSISGRVSVNIAGYSGLGVKNATVLLQETGNSVPTDASGNFTLQDILFGNYTLIISAPNLDAITQSISVNKESLQLTLPVMNISTATCGVKGDVNSDNKLGMEDAIYIMQVLSGNR